MINLPTKESGVNIVSSVKKTSEGELVRYSIHDDHNWKICEIDITTPEDIARQIATAIKEARDIGFEQGRAYIRRAMGVI
jgi:hypothetical protein